MGYVILILHMFHTCWKINLHVAFMQNIFFIHLQIYVDHRTLSDITIKSINWLVIGRQWITILVMELLLSNLSSKITSFFGSSFLNVNICCFSLFCIIIKMNIFAVCTGSQTEEEIWRCQNGLWKYFDAHFSLFFWHF